VTGVQTCALPILIVRGRANLLEDAKAAEDLDRVRQLFN
jgi:heat-inducible transcriptional repressor